MIRVVPGYSTDNNPERNQVVPQMICANRTTLPIAIEALSGNINDRASFVETVKPFYRQCKDAERPWMVMDSAFYSASSIQTCGDIQWITRVPETIKEVKRWVVVFSEQARKREIATLQNQTARCCARCCSAFRSCLCASRFRS